MKDILCATPSRWLDQYAFVTMHFPLQATEKSPKWEINRKKAEQLNAQLYPANDKRPAKQET